MYLFALKFNKRQTANDCFVALHNNDTLILIHSILNFGEENAEPYERHFCAFSKNSETKRKVLHFRIVVSKKIL